MKINIPSLRSSIVQGNLLINNTDKALKLIDRIEHIDLHAHTYSFYLNLQHSSFDIFDFCAFAVENKLQGVNIHIDAGNDKSISNYSPKKLRKLRNYLEFHHLNINIEASSTSKKVISKSVYLANSLGAKNIRVYDRYKGQLSDIIQKCIKRMKDVAQTAKKYDLHFVIEPHEVLKSDELVKIIEAVNSPRVNLLFDFGNMLSTAEQPLKALQTMQPYIRQAHLKGANIEAIGQNGFAQIGVRQGDDDLPHELMLYKLLMLGDTTPQVGAYSLEQQVGYYAPPYRFENESQNPFIPKRKPSKTQLQQKFSLHENLIFELQNAYHQVDFVNKTLESLTNRATEKLRERKMVDSYLELQL